MANQSAIETSPKDKAAKKNGRKPRCRKAVLPVCLVSIFNMGGYFNDLFSTVNDYDQAKNAVSLQSMVVHSGLLSF